MSNFFATYVCISWQEEVIFDEMMSAWSMVY